jgi:hypothetical protein
MAAVSMTQGLKMIGDRASGVAGAAAAIAGMSFDDGAVAFANTHTAANSGGAVTNFQGNALDSTPTGGAAATPYIVSHVCTLTTAQLNGVTVKRIALHNSAAPTTSSTTLMFGLDTLSFLKAAGFALIPTFKLQYA